MDLDKLVAVSGFSGIFRMAVNRKNGLILENIDTKKKNFYSSRKHQFTPLASIGIFTLDDSTELKIIFRTMVEQMESNPVPSTNGSSKELHAIGWASGKQISQAKLEYAPAMPWKATFKLVLFLFIMDL